MGWRPSTGTHSWLQDHLATVLGLDFGWISPFGGEGWFVRVDNLEDVIGGHVYLTVAHGLLLALGLRRGLLVA